MKPPARQLLLNSLLAGEESADIRRASLDFGLAALGRRRHRRRITRLCAIAGLPLLLGAIALIGFHAAEIRRIAVAHAARSALIAAGFKSRPIEVINDEQLFALFPDRPIALVGEPGQQKLVFLDQAAADPAEDGTRGSAD